MAQKRIAVNTNQFSGLQMQTVNGKGGGNQNQQNNNSGRGGFMTSGLTVDNLYGEDRTAALLVKGQTISDIPLKIKIENTGASAYSNFPLMAGYMAYPHNQDLSFLASEGGAIKFSIENFKEQSPRAVLGSSPSDKDFYTFVTALLGNKASIIGRIKIRTDKEENIRTVLKSYGLEITGRQREGKTWELDASFSEPVNTPSVYRHDLDLSAEPILISGFDTTLFLEELAANSYISLEIFFLYAEDGKILSQI